MRHITEEAAALAKELGWSKETEKGYYSYQDTDKAILLWTQGEGFPPEIGYAPTIYEMLDWIEEKFDVFIVMDKKYTSRQPYYAATFVSQTHDKLNDIEGLYSRVMYGKTYNRDYMLGVYDDAILLALQTIKASQR